LNFIVGNKMTVQAPSLTATVPVLSDVDESCQSLYTGRRGQIYMGRREIRNSFLAPSHAPHTLYGNLLYLNRELIKVAQDSDLDSDIPDSLSLYSSFCLLIWG
jgi:hypothetical protein